MGGTGPGAVDGARSDGGGGARPDRRVSPLHRPCGLTSWAFFLRVAVSPRFLPDDILHAPEIPRTLSGKKQEVPIKKLYLGHNLEKVINREAMANPDCLSFYLPLASAHAAKSQA